MYDIIYKFVHLFTLFFIVLENYQYIHLFNHYIIGLSSPFIYSASFTLSFIFNTRHYYLNTKHLSLTDSWHHEYNKIWALLLIALLLCLVLFFIAYFFSFSTIKDSEKLSEYECGFEPFDNATRHPFDVHFYIVGILFLIFDVEIALLFPWVLSLYGVNNWFSFYIMIIFLGLLTVGFFYEWHRGALVWPHQQYSTIFTDYRSNLS